MEKHPGKIEPTGKPDPLVAYYGKPMVSVPGPSDRYLGRVVIEIFEAKNAIDGIGLAYTVDPASEGGLDHDALAKRVAEVFATRVGRISFSKNK